MHQLDGGTVVVDEGTTDAWLGVERFDDDFSPFESRVKVINFKTDVSDFLEQLMHRAVGVEF